MSTQTTEPCKFRLCDWERNGYNDSDFYGMYYDEADGQLHTIELGTTRFACSTYHFTEDYLMPTPEIVEKARVILADLIFKSIRFAEHNDVMEPQPGAMDKGVKIKLLEDHAFMLAEKEERPCFKCDGSGSFKGRNGKVLGPCFTCKGSGKLNCKTGKRIKGENGKVKRHTIKAGTEFTLFAGVDFFGTVYRSGYNKVSRYNSTVRVQVDTEAGRQTARLPMEKVRLAREPMSDKELRGRAESLSYNYQFGAVGGCTAWLSNNWAAAVGAKQQAIAA